MINLKLIPKQNFANIEKLVNNLFNSFTLTIRKVFSTSYVNYRLSLG